MGQNTVQFILQSDDAQAIRAAERLLTKAQQTGQAFEETGKKGTTSFNQVGDAAQKMLNVVTAGYAGFKLIQDGLEEIGARAQAIREEFSRSGQASQSYGDAFGQLMMNMPGVSDREVQFIDQSLRHMAGSRALGTGGLVRLTDAMTTVQSSIPLASTQAKLDVMSETAQAIELEPRADASGIALGIAKLMESSGFSLSANQAQNLLRTQQSLGLVKEVGAVSGMIPQLGAAARMGGVDMPTIQALAAFGTQATGDTTGEETTTLMVNLASKLMTQTEDIEAATGISFSGNMIERLQQLRAGRMSGEVTDAELAKAFPKIGAKGAGGRAFIDAFVSEQGFGLFRDTLSQMTSPGVMQGDLMAESIQQMNLIPGQNMQARRRQMLSQIETERVADVQMSGIDAEAAVFKEEMARNLRSPKFQEVAINTFVGAMRRGADTNDARMFANSAADPVGLGFPAPGAGLASAAYAAGKDNIMESLPAGPIDWLYTLFRRGTRDGVKDGMKESAQRVGAPEDY